MEQMEVEKARLAKEKIDLEATLESESEYIVNKLQVQVSARRRLPRACAAAAPGARPLRTPDGEGYALLLLGRG